MSSSKTPLKKKGMYEFDSVWGDVDDRGDDLEFFGILWGGFRTIFDLALLCIAAVFLVQHDTHEFPSATALARSIASLSAVSIVVNIIELFAYADPTEDSPLPILIHFLFATGRFLIVLLGLVPKNSLRHIWVQYKRDNNGGVIIALLVVLWLTDIIYCLLGLDVLIRFLIFPCWFPYHMCISKPLNGIKRRAKGNREVEDKQSSAGAAAAVKQGR